MNYSMGKGRMLPRRWFKVYMVKSGSVVNSFSFFAGNEQQKSVFGEEQHAQEQEQGKELISKRSRQAYVWNVAEN